MERTVTLCRLRRRDEEGASLVEFALIVTLLCTLLLGIVIFGVLLSKRQVLTQAVAEGARFAVPVGYADPTVPANVLVAAHGKTNQSLEAIGNRQCPAAGVPGTYVLQVGSLTVDGIRCTFTVFDCATPGVQTIPDTKDCIEVKVELSVNNGPALVPGSSMIDPLLPSTMTGTSIVGLSGLGA